MTTLTVEPLGDNWHVAGGASWIGPFPSKEAAQRYVQRDKLLEALEKLLEETTWITRETSEWANSCAACGAIADDPDNHAPDCALVQARAAIAAARGVESGHGGDHQANDNTALAP